MDRRHTAGIVKGIIATIVGLVVVGVILVISGVYDIAATSPHTRPVRRAIGTLTHNSISKRAAQVELPAAPDSAGLLEGIEHYDEMCAVCHTAPGRERSEIAKGLYPRPPRFTHEMDEWSDAELFWITKHGIKMTGMPAFGPTHSDAVIRDIVAAMRRLPRLSAEQYRSLLDQAHAEGHVHGEEDVGEADEATGAAAPAGQAAPSTPSGQP